MEDNYSTLRLFRYYFQFLAIIGIFPFQVNFDPIKNCLKGITYHRSGKYYIINNAVAILTFMYTIIAVAILIRYVHTNGGCGEHTVPHASWVMTLSFLMVLLLTVNFKKDRICTLFNQWIRIQASLVRGKGCKF